MFDTETGSHVVVVQQPSTHMTLIQRRFNVDATSCARWECIETAPIICAAHLCKRYIDDIESGHIISYTTACAPSEDSDQTAHPRNLIRVFVGHSVGSQGSKESSGGCILIGNAVSRLILNITERLVDNLAQHLSQTYSTDSIKSACH